MNGFAFLLAISEKNKIVSVAYSEKTCGDYAAIKVIKDYVCKER